MLAVKLGTAAAVALIAAQITTPAGATPNDAPHFQVTGTCVSDYNGGVLHSDSYGFKPNGDYITRAWYPDGKPIIGIRNPGQVDKLGHTSGWQWICDDGQNGLPLPAGVYRLQIKDVTTGMVAKARLRILPARCEKHGAKHCDFSQP